MGVLSDGMSSRLFTEVREKRGLCYTVYASCHSLKDRGSVICYAGTTTERAQETLDVMFAELVRLEQGIQPDELHRLKARIKSSLIMQQESSTSRSGSIAADWYYLNRVRTLDELGAIIDGSDVRQHQSVFGRQSAARFLLGDVRCQAVGDAPCNFGSINSTTVWKSSPSAIRERIRRRWRFSSTPAHATSPTNCGASAISWNTWSSRERRAVRPRT